MKILLIYIILNAPAGTKTTVEQHMPSLKVCKSVAHSIVQRELPKHVKIISIGCKVQGSM